MSATETVDKFRCVFTIERIAEICDIPLEDSCHWFDTGDLKGFILPGTQDRRVTRSHLIKWLTNNEARESLARIGEPFLE